MRTMVPHHLRSWAHRVSLLWQADMQRALSGLRKADIGMGRAGEGKHGTVIRRLHTSDIAFQELHPPSFALPSVAIAVHVGLNLGRATAARSDDCSACTYERGIGERRVKRCPAINNPITARRSAGGRVWLPRGARDLLD